MPTTDGQTDDNSYHKLDRYSSIPKVG